MLSQGTSPKSRDRGGAGSVASLFVCPDGLSEVVGQMLRDHTQFAVALDFSGVPLKRRMSVDEIVAAAAAGVTVLGYDTVVHRAELVRYRNLRFDCMAPDELKAFERDNSLWTSWRRHYLASDLAHRVRWAVQDAVEAAGAVQAVAA